MSNPAPQLVQKLWSYSNILREDGLSYSDYAEQLTFLLFLKMAKVERRLSVVEELESVVIPTVKQSFIRISCVMRTAEMTNRSHLADFWLDGDEQIRMLGYSYHSKPLPTIADRSQPHDGTIVFELVGNPVEKLKGTYWTERKTTGEVVLIFREQTRLEEFPSDVGKHPVSGKS
jgi:hypothetical protein